jgi:predicted phage terminase large subunit-like protein
MPEYRTPEHLGVWLDLIERAAAGEPVRALCSYPIRHFKTETTLLGIVWLLVQDPTARWLLLTHSFERARTIGKELRRYAQAARVGPVVGFNTIDSWQNEHGGGAVVMSAEQSRLGENVHGLLFDDPLDEYAAEDIRRRDAVDRTIIHYTTRCQRAGRPGPVLGVMSRWHPDDPIGRRLERKAEPWIHAHQPAIIDDGLPTERAFAESVVPLVELRRKREIEREIDPTLKFWWAQQMGDPQPEGTRLFRADPERYNVLPEWNFRLAFGADLAFSAGEGSDYFALVAVKIIGTKCYVLESTRTRLEPHMIESTCNAFLSKYGNLHAPIYSYVSGPEVGTVKLMRERGLNFWPLRAKYNKLVRAQRTIKRWNDGYIVVPAAAPWVPPFLRRVENFRGEDKGHDDDEVDALVSVCDGAMGGTVAGGGGGPRTVGRAYRGMF